MNIDRILTKLKKERRAIEKAIKALEKARLDSPGKKGKETEKRAPRKRPVPLDSEGVAAAQSGNVSSGKIGLVEPLSKRVG